MKFQTLAFLITSAVLAANPPTADDELHRLWKEYQARLAATLEPHLDAYLKDLQKLERDATRNNDTIALTATRKEYGSSDHGLTPLAIPNKKTSPQITELRRLRADFERKRDEAVRACNLWCRGQLELVEREFLQRKDPISAATIHAEYDALSKPPLQIVRASYGAERTVDVTLPLRKAIRFNHLETPGGNNLAGDPIPYRRKSGSITYRFGTGQEKTIGFGEDGTIKIP